MINRYLVFILFVFSQSASATTVFFHDALSKLGPASTGGVGYGCSNGNNNWVFRKLDTTQGSALVSHTFQPTATAAPCIFQTANSGQYLRFATAPLNAAVTISGTIDLQIGCLTNSTSTNVGLGVRVYRWTQQGGIKTLILDSPCSNTPNKGECNTTANLKQFNAASPTSTNFLKGDRIIIDIELRNVNGAWGGNSNRTVTLYFDGPAGGNGDSYVVFTDTLTFQTDTAQAGPVVQ
jgi:hypothetical protein